MTTAPIHQCPIRLRNVGRTRAGAPYWEWWDQDIYQHELELSMTATQRILQTMGLEENEIPPLPMTVIPIASHACEDGSPWDMRHEFLMRVTIAELIQEAGYHAYLESRRWHETRLAALRIADFRCQRCGSIRRLQAHHLEYDNLGVEPREDLIVLCRKCHAELEGQPA